MKATQPPRQERSRQTYEALLDAAEELGIDNTYDQISVQKIATHAGFTIGAFYARFPSKGALAMALMDRYEAMVEGSKAHLAAVDSNDQLVVYLASSLVKAYTSDTGRMRLLESALHADRMLASRFENLRVAILDFIVETLGRAYSLPRTDLETAALLLVMPLRELHFKREFWPKQGTDVAALTERVVDGVIVFLEARRSGPTRSAEITPPARTRSTS